MSTLEPLDLYPGRPALDGLLDGPALERDLAGCETPLPLLREALKRGDAALRRHFEQGADAVQLVYGRCWLCDRLIQHAWRHLFGTSQDDIALVAVGGYGRAELLPGSDIDLLILLEEEAEARHAAQIEAFLTALWDLGLEVGHSVRSIADCIEQGRADITVATNLLEARLLAGAETLFQAMRRVTAADRMWSGPEYFEAKLKEQQARHLKFHDTAYNLEPNIKENPGGLRDIQMIGWVAKRHYGCTTLHGLVEHGFLTDHEYRTLIEGQSFLWRIRFALHTLSRRREDRLLFDHQRSLAELFGYRAAKDSPNLAVELFMKDYYQTVMELERLNEMLLQLFKEHILHADDPGEPQPINRRFQSRHGFLEVSHPGIFERYPFALLEVFLLLAERPALKGVRAATIRLIRDHRHLIDDDFRNDLRARSLFMELMRQPQGVTHELRRMNRYGILAAYIPAFARIVGQMQYDLFHAYTVDEHTLFVVRNLRRFTVEEFADELPFASELIKTIPKLELLLLAGLFHDIAKGRGGDHSELGASDAEAFCRHHGLSDHDSRLVAWLVRNHLLMSTTTQRRDISEPAVINEFARQVGNRVRLDYLYLLTVADIRGTNPTLWNSWKGSLLYDLYQSTAKALRRGLENPMDQAELIAARRREALDKLQADDFETADIEALWSQFADEYFLRHSAEEIVWHAHTILRRRTEGEPVVAIRPNHERGGTGIFVYMRVHRGLFEQMTALLDQLGLNIVDARILTSHDQHALDTYLVLDNRGQPIQDEHQIQQIHEVLRRGLAAAGGERPRVTRRMPRQFRHFDIRTRIDFSRDEANRRTVMELVTGDRPGLLSLVGSAFTACGVNLENARIATFGSRAEDVFYITDQNHRAIEDEAILDCLRRHILNALREAAS
ncbi:[protein-PII] uridylyltransferase [Thiohalobacter sp. IOR34]|uniref:[protein-PII] uridylyltransferase n=1 Tax=Thiohalobacter sp. IOR34 TaxID=3057176 RepID=UPI0025B214F6|nr:[protein-PII] uridylyltransferase [Thiohalobacter sp. IOR34]WJW76572.1 [protein-PII] uridylyltransferase [Thiohalobacter sp. IOR34]